MDVLYDRPILSQANISNREENRTTTTYASSSDANTAASAAAASSSSFLSWEIEGVIKENPQDFVLREILSRNFKIPGICKEDQQFDKSINVQERETETERK
jgi:hypothetical protein